MSGLIYEASDAVADENFLMGRKARYTQTGSQRINDVLDLICELEAAEPSQKSIEWHRRNFGAQIDRAVRVGLLDLAEDLIHTVYNCGFVSAADADALRRISGLDPIYV